MDKFIIANLIKTIQFTWHGSSILLPADTIIHVNIIEGYAMHGTKRFDIFRDEYALTQ